MTDRPNWGALEGMLKDLRRTVSTMDDTQKRMLQVTGTAWSDDGMIKVVVGPRGHLLELDIDPRVLRKPNSKALSTAILATARLAVEDAAAQSKAILDDVVPRDLRGTAGADGTDLTRIIGSHDADVRLTKDDDE
ncbi:YbaB/EbfC family nucleoid-associated protein [Polymorphospora rubra]|uniref:YbaB/EbfC family nucleoid-associated protein n=1 Tax=Polymorphospora rubra TaxID=338584 RepID=UPI0033CA6EC6